MDESPTCGKITVAPEVLETIARLTALAVPGVVRLTPPLGFQRLLGIQDGVQVIVSDGRVAVELHIVAESGRDILALGRQIQHEVTRAIEDIVGLPVTHVNVTVEDVVPAPKD